MNDLFLADGLKIGDLLPHRFGAGAVDIQLGRLGGAVFAPMRDYRYLLWRDLANDGPTIAVGMLNPSIANGDVDDPTVTRVTRRARDMGARRLFIWNAYALVSTFPDGLYDAADPVGQLNDDYIRYACRQTQPGGMVIVGWGGHATYQKRAARVFALIRETGVTPHAWRINRDGSPGHPLYLPYSLRPQPMPETLETP